MAKQNRPVPQQPAKPQQRPVYKPAPKAEVELPPEPMIQGKPWSLYDFKVQAIIVALLGFIFYINTYNNEYAHDDGIVLVKNEFVLEGLKGIPNILTKDAYYSYYRQLNTTNQLSGGRFRPLSIITFAIEQQFFGAVPEASVDSVLRQNQSYGVRGPQEQKLVHDMHIRHLISVLWYVLSLVVLLYFLRYIVFRREPIMAFIAAIIFAIHPIHTEVVANVKSRDEIMSLLFMCLTFIYTFKYYEKGKKIGYLIAALVSYFLAFLSKEYAITLVVLLPLSLYLFNNFTIKKSILAFLPFIVVIGVYLMMRYHTMEPVSEGSNDEVLNNPYLFATSNEKLATEISTCLRYIKLLFFPYPLSADYSYNTIPYVDFTDLMVWVSFIIHTSLLLAMVAFAKKALNANKSITFFGINMDAVSLSTARILCFGLAFYFLHFILICNIVFDIGATMGERLIYHSSVGFAICVALLLVKGFEKIKIVSVSQWSLGAFMLIIIVLSGFETVKRNADWVNDSTLFGADIKTVPNSVLVSANVAASYITISDLQKNDSVRKDYLVRAVALLDHTLSIHHKFVAAFLNRGIAYYKLGDVDKAKANMDTVRSLYPTYPVLPGMYKLISDYYSKNGWENYGKRGLYPQAIAEFKKGLAIDPNNPDLWYNLGGACFSNKQYADAAYAWQKVLSLTPNNQNARAGLVAAQQAIQQTKGAAPAQVH
jgi:hypothetical protein